MVAQWVALPFLIAYTSPRAMTRFLPDFSTWPSAIRILAIGGRQQVELEFDGQHFGAGRHQGEPGIAAGAIDDGAVMPA